MILYSRLLRALNKAICGPPPRSLREIYGAYYSPYYGLFYYLNQYTPLTCVEIGVEKGRGVASMAAGNPDSQIYGLDNHQREEIAGLLEKYPNIHFWEKSALPVPSEIPDCIDLLHVDTEHSYGNAKNEFGQYKSRLNPEGAVVCFDDTHAMDDGVLQFVHELPYPKIIDDRLHPVCGYAVVYYKEET